MEYSTAAAIGSNILAAFALAVAYASYRLSRRTESRLQDESEPAVSAKAWPLDKHPKWHRLQIKVINHSRYVLEEGSIEFKWPIGCKALAWDEATYRPVSGGALIIKDPLPVALSRRKIMTSLKVQPSGVSGSNLFLGTTDTLTLEFAVYQGIGLPFLSHFVLDVRFVSNLSDIRRVARHVSRQRVVIPRRQST